MRGLIVVSWAAACATPYQEKGLRGGYTNTRIGADTWMISVEVNSYTSRSTAIEYTYRRASELCSSGFDVMDADRSSHDFYVRYGDTVQNAPKSGAMLVVRCRQTSDSTGCGGDPRSCMH